MTKANNLTVDDRLHGSAGPFGPDVDGDFAVEGRKLAWVDTVDSKIATVLINQMTEEQVEAIAETAIANAQATGDIAQQTWVNSQGFLKSVATDGTTITGDGTNGNPLVAHGGSSSPNVTYNRSTGELIVDGISVTNLSLGMGAINADTIRTTSIVEGIGGILAGSFLQNEEGEDYILQKDVEAGYVKKTDLVVDSVPMLNSAHLITSGGVYTPVQQVTTDLSTHKTTDKFRWQDTYDEQLLSIVRDGESQGLKLAGSFGGAEYPFTVTDEYGGIIAMQFINPNISIFYTVYINGLLKYSSEGLPPGIPVTKYMKVNNGDVITSLNNPNILNYNYFVADPESPFYKMVQQVTVNQQMIGSLQNNILDIKASIDNKILDPEPTHVQSILNGTYTVTNSLGGRLNGKGYVLLGLLGVKLVSTGIVDVTYTNGKTIREYDNTALVGAGEANPFVLDIDIGTVIVSSGMDSLTFTPYVAK